MRGTRNISVANPDEIIKINKIVSAALWAPQAEGMRVYVLGVSTSTSALIGDAPIKKRDGIGIFDYGEESAKKWEHQI